MTDDQRKKALEALEAIELFDAMREMAKHTNTIRQALTEPDPPHPTSGSDDRNDE